MHWENELAARPEDTVETEQPKEQPLPLTTEEPPHPPSVTNETEAPDDLPTDPPEERTYVDADAEVPEPEEYSLDPTTSCATTRSPGFLRK